MRRRALIAALVDEILARKRASRPLLVAIDGRCGSGKTMLADEVARALAGRPLEVLRLSVDGFHHPKEYRHQQGEDSARGYYEDAFDCSAIVKHLLGPLSGDVFPAMCRPVVHDWRTDLAVDAPAIEVGADAVLLFDGVFVLRRELDPYWDLRILVEVDAETAIARAIERDGRGDRDGMERKYRVRYEPAWRLYAEAEEPERKADWIVSNRAVQNPMLVMGKRKRLP